MWRLFAHDLDLSEAKKQRFASLHDCFVRELRAGARTIDQRAGIVVSPCDAVVGAYGQIRGTQVFQAKGFPYDLEELLPDEDAVECFRDGVFVTLRLKSSMYHRFHAPVDCAVRRVVYFSGDTWNVNPIALKRIEKLFCKNERAFVELHQDDTDRHLAVVPVAAILVASMRFHCLSYPLNLGYRGANELTCEADYRRGDEMGYFEHGSTFLVFASRGYDIVRGVQSDSPIRVGQPLLKAV